MPTRLSFLETEWIKTIRERNANKPPCDLIAQWRAAHPFCTIVATLIRHSSATAGPSSRRIVHLLDLKVVYTKST